MFHFEFEAAFVYHFLDPVLYLLRVLEIDIKETKFCELLPRIPKLSAGCFVEFNYFPIRIYDQNAEWRLLKYRTVTAFYSTLFFQVGDVLRNDAYCPNLFGRPFDRA